MEKSSNAFLNELFTFFFLKKKKMAYDPIRSLETMGRNVAKMPISRIPTAKKVLFICVNCYKSYRGNLGTAPINDSVSFAKLMKNFDFQIFILHTPHARNFLPIFDKFLQNTEDQLVFYYAGQPLIDIDTTDDIDEFHFQFDDGNVSQVDVARHIRENKNPESQLFLITQRAPKGSIFAFEDGKVEGEELPEKCVSISAIRDERVAATQTMTMANDEGIFTFTLCQELKAIKDCTPNQLKEAMKKTIADYGHIVEVSMTSPEMGDEPMFFPDYD
jgi:hypothetical protein